MKIILGIGSLVILAGAAFYAFGPYPPFWVQSSIRSSMTEWTRDPGSLQFIDLRYSPDDGDVVCGKMNAKNAVGAYTGFKKFAHVKSRNFTFLQGIDPSADGMISLFKCD